MSTYWFYLFADPRYTMGVKFGYCSSSRAADAWKAAPSYAPEGMLYLASWPVTLPFSTADHLRFEQHEVQRLEAHILGKLGQRMNQMPNHERAGREWVNATAADAIAIVSALIMHAPTVQDLHLDSEVTTNDNFRWPHPRDLRDYALAIGVRHPVKIAVWIYEESLTGRLKTQFVHDWSSPFEKARRYSRNGLIERAAFSYLGPACPDGNERVYGAWREAMCVHGPGPDDRRHGWLNEGVCLATVEELYRRLGLVRFAAVRRQVPEGIRPAYNRAP